MYREDIALLCCPVTHSDLVIVRIDEVAADGEIIRGELQSQVDAFAYSIENGIPRFACAGDRAATWNYKWTQIDRGRGLNYRIIDRNDPAYRIHDLFDRNSHGGSAFARAQGGLALDLGCGVGQYTVRLLREHAPAKVVGIDITTAVDTFRAIMLDRYPEWRRRLLLVQADVFRLPFRDASFDYVMSLGVLMHTGDTRRAITQAARLLREGGELNLWVYGPALVHIDIEETGRSSSATLARFLPSFLILTWTMAQVRLFRRLPHRWVAALIEAFSSDAWYRLCRLPLFGRLFRAFFATVMHPDRDYRHLNNYDGWCNRWADTWTEQELFPTLREAKVAVLGLSEWRTGIWGRKISDFFP